MEMAHSNCLINGTLNAKSTTGIIEKWVPW